MIMSVPLEFVMNSYISFFFHFSGLLIKSASDSVRVATNPSPAQPKQPTNNL